MAAGNLVVVTGYREVDAKLRSLEPKIQRKFVRGALRKCTKRLNRELQRILKAEAYDTGSYAKSIKAKALKRSRNRIGVATYTDTTKLYARYEAAHGHKPHPAKGRSEPFFYPAVLEFGSDTQEALAPMRRALYDNADTYREYFKADVLQFIAENKVTVALPKVGK